MKNLGKESFWEPMLELYPAAVHRFHQWIQEYKILVDWKYLFHSNPIDGECTTEFHDPPYEMQMGIMNRFFIEQFASPEEFADPNRVKAYHGEMAYALKRLNEEILKTKP